MVRLRALEVLVVVDAGLRVTPLPVLLMLRVQRERQDKGTRVAIIKVLFSLGIPVAVVVPEEPGVMVSMV